MYYSGIEATFPIRRLKSSVKQANRLRAYGVLEMPIYKWIKRHSPIEGTNVLTVAVIAAIQKENLRLKQGGGILKGFDHIGVHLHHSMRNGAF